MLRQVLEDSFEWSDAWFYYGVQKALGHGWACYDGRLTFHDATTALHTQYLCLLCGC